MEMLLRCFALLSMMAVSLLGPGLYLARRMVLEPLERVTLAIALSAIFLYLLCFGVFAFGLPPIWLWAVSLSCVLLFFLSWSDLGALFTDKDLCLSWRAVLFLAIWLSVHLLVVRNVSGGRWWGDWFEHYQRASFYYYRPGLDFRFISYYWLPARPPLINVLVSYWLSSVEFSFPLYQVAVAASGLLTCLPVFLFAKQARPDKDRVLLVTVFLLALSPMFLQNTLFPWTRQFTNFLVLSGLYFYWRGIFADRMLEVGIALVIFAAAILAHYSAAPYAIAVLGHMMWRLGPLRILREKRLLGMGLASAVLLATWFGWSWTHFGTAITFGSNTTVTGSYWHNRSQLVANVFYNLWSTFVPYWFRSVDLAILSQDGLWNYWRDAVFLVVQTNALGALGLSAGILFLFHVGAEIRRAVWRESQWRFWAGLSGSIIVLAMIVNEKAEPFGSAHVCLQPLILLASVRVAGLLFEHGAVVRACLAAGVGLGYFFGIFLHFWYQAVSYDGRQALLAHASVGTRTNWVIKDKMNLTFLGDMVAPYQQVLFSLEIAMALLLFVAFYRYCLQLSVTINN